MDSWERFDDTLLPKKEDFDSNIGIVDITDADYKHAKSLWKQFKTKNVGKYYDLYVQSDKLLLADVFENFQNKSIEIYDLDPAHFFICTWISKASMFKENRNKIEIIS